MNSKYRHYAVLSAVCSLCLFRHDVSAAELQNRPGVYTLGEIVVSGQEDEGVQASETVHTVTAEDIRRRGARTLDQAIALLPGVNVRIGGEGVPRIDIRGFRTRHVVLLLDGIPMNSALDQQFDPTLIPTENIAEIKLTEGASSVLYGQGGLGGVINIITRKGTSGVQGMVAGESGDHAPYLGKARISGATDRFSYLLSGSTGKVDGYPLSDGFRSTSEQGAGYRINSDRERNSMFGSVDFTPNRDLALGLTFNLSQGSFGKPASIVNDSHDPFASPPKYERIDNATGVSAQLAADYQVTDQLSLRGWVFTNQFDGHDNLFDTSSFNSINLAGSFREHVTSSISGVSLQPRYDLGKAGTVTLSLAGERDNWNNSGQQSLGTIPPTFVPLDGNKYLSIYSAGIEYELSPLPGLGLVAGYGHYLQTRDELNSDDYGVLAGASYDLSRETRLKASFKRNVRFPSLGDLYDLSKGNPNLSAERSYTYETGVERKLPRESTASITGFYTQAINLIQNDQSTSRNTNLAEVRFAGIELSAATRWVKNLLLRASYAHLYSKDRSRAGRDQQQYTPGDKATLEVTYDFGSGFSTYASLLYVGNQYFYTKNNVTPVQKAQLNDYTLVNLKLSQRVLDNKVTLYLGADNLFDENYETSYGMPQAGRYIYGGVEIRM
ncbi:MAG: TonB-dependent receptor [Geobacteraceae bacterium]|nr:TonB-dependent receptor [Geobacteraceae bacterium]